MDGLVDTVKKLTINDSEYYESDTATASDTQDDPIYNPEKVNHTGNRNERVTNTNNGNFEQKLLSNRTIPIVVRTMIPRIEQSIAPIVMAPQTILIPMMKESVVHMASGGTGVNKTPQ